MAEVDGAGRGGFCLVGYAQSIIPIGAKGRGDALVADEGAFLALDDAALGDVGHEAGVVLDVVEDGLQDARGSGDGADGFVFLDVAAGMDAAVDGDVVPLGDEGPVIGGSAGGGGGIRRSGAAMEGDEEGDKRIARHEAECTTGKEAMHPPSLSAYSEGNAMKDFGKFY